jgi:hypothetical protein
MSEQILSEDALAWRLRLVAEAPENFISSSLAADEIRVSHRNLQAQLAALQAELPKILRISNPSGEHPFISWPVHSDFAFSARRYPAITQALQEAAEEQR